MQNSHDRETCARSLRATQESRPSPGAFPPPPPCTGIQQQPQPQPQQQQQPSRAGGAGGAEQQRASQQRCCAMNQVQRGTVLTGNNVVGRPHRPASLDIGMTRRCPAVGCSRVSAAGVTTTTAAASSSAPMNGVVTPTSAPAACTSRGFFDDCTVNSVGNANGNATPGFELNVNVACSPAGNRGKPV